MRIRLFDKDKDFGIICDFNYKLMLAHKANTLMPFKFEHDKAYCDNEVETCIANGDTFFIAENDLCKPIGMCSVTSNDRPGKVTAPEVHWLYVAEGYRGRGVGTTLLKEALIYMKKTFPEAPGFSIGAEYWNEGAWSLYERMGFAKQSIKLFYANEPSTTERYPDIYTPDEKIYN